jgi:hypothetical protein
VEGEIAHPACSCLCSYNNSCLCSYSCFRKSINLVLQTGPWNPQPFLSPVFCEKLQDPLILGIVAIDVPRAENEYYLRGVN